MSNRSVAYIAQISQLEDIPGKDRIKLASLKDLGFKVIVGTNVTLNEKVIYIEYDTIIDESQGWAEFLRSRCYSPKYRGFYIRAMKMAGVYSEGIVFKIDDVAPFMKWDSHQKKYYSQTVQNGTDLSSLLQVKSIDDDSFSTEGTQEKITKFQRFLKKYGYFIWKLFYYRKPSSKAFPSFAVNKSDETRVQKLNYLFAGAWKGQQVYISTKVDGKSSTFVIYNNRFIIASRNFTKYDRPLKKAIKELTCDKARHYKDEFIYVAAKYNLPKQMAEFQKKMIPDIKNFALQAELCGPGIQGNKLDLQDYEIFTFNLYDSEEKKYLIPFYLCSLIKFNIPTVPDIHITKFDWDNVEQLNETAKGFYSSGKPREGIVIRAFDFNEFYIKEPCEGMSNCCSWKVINPDFVVKE